MMEVQTFCVNHPKVATLVRCSNCNSPICPKCMVTTPVGQKCRSCAKFVYRKPAGGARHYLAGGAGLLCAAVLEVLLRLLPLGFLALLVNLVIGYVTGSVVRSLSRGAASAGPTAAVAAGCGIAIGLLFMGVPLQSLFRVGVLFSLAIASYVAWFRASH